MCYSYVKSVGKGVFFKLKNNCIFRHYHDLDNIKIAIPQNSLTC